MKGHLTKLEKLFKRIPPARGLVIIGTQIDDGIIEWKDGIEPTEEQRNNPNNTFIIMQGVSHDYVERERIKGSVINFNHRPVKHIQKTTILKYIEVKHAD